MASWDGSPSAIVRSASPSCRCFGQWAHLRFDYQSIEHLLNGLQSADFIAGLVLIIATLEMARRSVGPVMMWVGLVFLLYAAFGNLLPDVLATKGFTFERIVRFQVFTGAGLFGAPLGIAAGAVFSFVLFGAFLQVTGAGKFLIDLSFAAAGRYRGGPAKASVIASAAMGSISGSAIANTVTTGSLTIPMMKKLATSRGGSRHRSCGLYRRANHAADHGAGAFVMAEFTKTSYEDIVWIAPYQQSFTFIGAAYVHVLAVKNGFQGMQGQNGACRVL